MQPTKSVAGSGADSSTQAPEPSSWPPEQAVLGHLLDAHPRRLDSVALTSELRGRLEPADIERAIGNLSEAGFLEETAGVLLPAPKVLKFEQQAG